MGGAATGVSISIWRLLQRRGDRDRWSREGADSPVLVMRTGPRGDHAPSREGRRHDNRFAGGHSGLAEVPYRCATAPEFHRTFPVLKPATTAGPANSSSNCGPDDT